PSPMPSATASSPTPLTREPPRGPLSIPIRSYLATTEPDSLSVSDDHRCPKLHPVEEPFARRGRDIHAAVTAIFMRTIRRNVRHVGARAERVAPRCVVDVVAAVEEEHRVVDVLRCVVVGRAWRPGRVEPGIADLAGDSVSALRRSQELLPS